MIVGQQRAHRLAKQAVLGDVHSEEFRPAWEVAGGQNNAAPDRTTTSHKNAGVTIFAIAEDFFDFPMGNDPTRKVWH
jgi:hypothetical protein